jgi:capsular polysaccharide biosynthesis protein
MSAVRPPADLGGEREIDLRRWLDVILARRWFVVAGLIVGVIVGGLYSLSGASTYEASVTIQPAQPFSPSGSPVLNYSASPLAIQVLVSSNAALKYVSTRAHMPEDELRGHVSTASISTGAGPVATRGTVLIEVTVSLPQAGRAQDAANAFGDYVVNETESSYVRESLQAYVAKDATYRARLNAVDLLISTFDQVLVKTKFADPFDKLVVVSELDAAIARQGNLQDLLITNQQSQTLAQDIEVAQIINPASAAKVTARSRRNSILFGGLIGVLVGGLVALVLGLRPGRPAAAK